MRCFDLISYSFPRLGVTFVLFSRYHGACDDSMFLFSAGHTLTCFRFLIFHCLLSAWLKAITLFFLSSIAFPVHGFPILGLLVMIPIGRTCSYCFDTGWAWPWSSQLLSLLHIF